ncbi:MAG: elongation factor G [Erysipelothrix sp.]|nr:elongation factor G [Erysipelothrix sp.]
MKDYLADQIRNIVLLGHSGSGKTSLVDSILYYNGVTDRMGNSNQGTSSLDFEPEEIEKGQSIYTAVIPVEWNDCKVNMLDTPGYLDFVGEQESALKVADNALIVVSAIEGVEAGTISAYREVNRLNLPTIFFINKLDDEKADFDQVYNSLREQFGKSVILFEIPIIEDRKVIGSVNILRNKAWYYNDRKTAKDVPENMKDIVDEYYNHLAEAVAMTDDSLMEKFFEGERFTEEEIAVGLKTAVREGEIRPVYCGSALNQTGIKRLLDLITEYFPNYEEKGTVEAFDQDNSVIELETNEQEHLSAFVFKTIIDPFVGKISYIKIMSGVLTSDSEIYNVQKRAVERINAIYIINGKYQEAVGKLFTGDIGAVVKLSNTDTNDTLATKDYPVKHFPIDFSRPMLGVAIEPKSKDDEDKLSNALHRITEENKTIRIDRNRETNQTVMYGIGSQLIDVAIAKMKARYRVEVIKQPLKVQYRETIKGSVLAEGKHKKQSGGSGQYGHVFVNFEPADTEEMIFEETVFGGSVPRQYFSAVEDGLREAMKEGVLAGYKMVGVKATLTDGSYHDVDSKDIAFKTAARIAYRAGIPKAEPVLLEPMVTMQVVVPEAYTGTIVGDLNKKRGIITGMDYDPYHDQIINAEVPMAEVIEYATDLRSMTQGKGQYTYELSRYKEVPNSIATAVIEANKKED